MILSQTHPNRTALLQGALASLSFFAFSACSGGNTPAAPPELKLHAKVYHAADTPAFGPSGLAEGLTAYRLDKEITTRLVNGGLNYLNTLPSASMVQKQPIEPFKTWQRGPIKLDKNWMRLRGIPVGTKPSALIAFFQDSEFANSLDSDVNDALSQAILSPNTLYAYGGHRGRCVILIDLANEQAYYLYRD